MARVWAPPPRGRLTHVNAGRFGAGTVARMPHSAPRVPDPSSPCASHEPPAGVEEAGSCYPCYPTPDRFVEAFGARQYRTALASRRAAAPLALYVHLPFCAAACAFCACNIVVARRRERASASAYLDALEAEIGLVAAELGTAPSVSQLHLGGGTPTFLTDAELERLMRRLRGAFRLSPAAEASIEVDPRTVDAARIGRLAALGFNRLTLGVPDLDPAVQRAVGRVHDAARVRALLDAARGVGFRSVEVELMCGLPLQTAASLARTVAEVCACAPERISLHGYLHRPHRFKPQRRIDAGLLPGAQQRLLQKSRAVAALADAGYEHLGLDRFARPGDALAAARRQGRLQRDFQGYTTLAPDGDLIGLGVSAIGRVGAAYAQNAASLGNYLDALRHGRFATARGLALTRDDLLRRAVIMALLCSGRVEFEAVELAHLVVDFQQRFAVELEALAPLAASGLVTIEPGAIDVTPLGAYFVGAVAAVFDRPLQTDRARERYSREI